MNAHHDHVDAFEHLCVARKQWIKTGARLVGEFWRLVRICPPAKRHGLDPIVGLCQLARSVSKRGCLLACLIELERQAQHRIRHRIRHAFVESSVFLGVFQIAVTVGVGGFDLSAFVPIIPSDKLDQVHMVLDGQLPHAFEPLPLISG